jgi:hypothetical protein
MCAAPAAQTPRSFQLEKVIEIAECPCWGNNGQPIDRAPTLAGLDPSVRSMRRILFEQRPTLPVIWIHQQGTSLANRSAETGDTITDAQSRLTLADLPDQ